MALSYVGGQVAGRANPTTAVSVNFSLTGGSDAVPAAGDLVIITCVTGSAAGNPAMAITTPTGYTALGQLNQSAVTADTSMNVSYKRMGGTPDTAFTVPGTGDNTWGEAYSVQVFRGVDATTPMDATAVSAGGTGTGRPDPGSITPVTTGAWVVICGGGAAGTGVVYTAPANFTTNFLSQVGADTTDAMVGSGYWTGWTSGAVNPAAYTGGTTGANDSWSSYTLALRPAAAPNHAATGALTGQGSTVAGSAAHIAIHGASGALAGQGATVAGTAARTRAHAASGVLAGQGATVAGTAARTRVHAASGVLAGAGSAIAGSAARSTSAVNHAASGALAGAGASLAGTASRTRAHAATAVLAGQGAQIQGAAELDAGPVTHSASGSLVGQSAVLVAAGLRGVILGAGRSGGGTGPIRPSQTQVARGRSVQSGARSNTQTAKR